MTTVRSRCRLEILRLRTAALIRIFTRTFGFLSTEVPASFSPNLHVSALSLELVSMSLSCTLPTRARRDVHQILCLPEPCPRTNLASARPCLTASRIFPLGDTASRNCCLRKLHHLTLIWFPEAILKCCLLVGFHVVPFKQPSCVSHHPRPYIHGWTHFQRETLFQLDTQASNLIFHCILCSPRLRQCCDCRTLGLPRP